MESCNFGTESDLIPGIHLFMETEWSGWAEGEGRPRPGPEEACGCALLGEGRWGMKVGCGHGTVGCETVGLAMWRTAAQ